MTFLARTEAALDEVRQYVGDSGAAGTAIESFLTQYLLISLCSEVEEALRTIVRERAREAGDQQIAAFVEVGSQRLLRSVKQSEIAGFLRHFGNECSEQFKAAIGAGNITPYNNAVANRHLVAHAAGVNVTLSELTTAVKSAEFMLSEVSSALKALPVSTVN